MGETAAPQLPPNLLAAVLHSAREHPERTAFQNRSGSVRLTWSEVTATIAKVAGGLARLGVGRDDAVALLIGNRPEFTVIDAAVVALGAIPVSIYLAASPEQVHHVIADAGARVIICDASSGGLVSAVTESPDAPAVDHVIVLDGDPDSGPDWGGLDGGEDRIDLTKAAQRVAPDDILTIVYTSGTTGAPKGAELTHRNVAATVASMSSVIPRREHMRLISWLPSAHAAERMANYYTAVYFAATVTCCVNVHEIGDCLREVRPSWFFGVPRVWEKLAEGLQAAWSAFPDEQQHKIADAVAAGMRKVALLQAGTELPDDLAATLEQADRDIFSLLRAAVGLDDLDAANVGSAPCPEEVITFFHAIGVPLSELWGMTETAAGGTVNPADRIRIGTVGPPAPGVDLRIAADGEVLIRGAMVTRGYRNLPEATAAAVDADGWLHTGDLGALDDDGYLRIIGRKKELIVNSYGKNMSPALIEGVLTASSPLIAHAVAIGDRRPYNVALIVLEPLAAANLTATPDQAESIPLPAERSTVADAVKSALAQANTKLSNVERIRRFHVLAEEWVPGSEQLTPTMKLRRANVVHRYSDVIDAIYDGTTGMEVNG